MTESIRPVYKCDFCGKNLLRKHAAIKHEDLCKKNPENIRPCLSCPHLLTDEFIVDYDDFGGHAAEKPRIGRAMFCTHYKKGVYAPWVEKKWDHAYEFLEENGEQYENEPMPEACEEYEADKRLNADLNFRW